MEDVKFWKTEAVLQVARRRKLFEDACPDVGMGVSWGCHVDDALKELGLTKNDVDYDYLLMK